MILDFNSKTCNFKLSEITEYDIDLIFSNMNKFKKFIGETALTHDFNKVYVTTNFQIVLCNPSFSYTDTLLQVYNATAKMLDIPLTTITEKQLISELRLRGYEVKRTSRKSFDGTQEKVNKIYLPNQYE